MQILIFNCKNSVLSAFSALQIVKIDMLMPHLIGFTLVYYKVNDLFKLFVGSVQSGDILSR